MMNEDFILEQNDRYILKKDMCDGKITLEIPFNAENIDKDRLKILTDHKTGTFTVFGKIENWDEKSSSLSIFPIVIY